MRPPAGHTRSAVVALTAAPASTDIEGVERRNLTLSGAGLAATFHDVGLSPALLAQVDDAFLWRLDLFAHLQRGDVLSIWHRGDELLAASVRVGRTPMIVARYSGDLAPRGFYDESGLGMRSALRSRPVDLGRITSSFGQRFDAFTGAPGFHRGVDYGVPVGTPIVAVGAARVKTVGKSATAGNFIKLAHAGGYESSYLHLDRIDVAKGALVDANTVIARSGNTGRSTGPHLHYELRLAGIALDPLATMPAANVALGPTAEREHVALIKQLQQLEDTHDGRTHR